MSGTTSSSAGEQPKGDRTILQEMIPDLGKYDFELIYADRDSTIYIMKSTNTDQQQQQTSSQKKREFKLLANKLYGKFH